MVGRYFWGFPPFFPGLRVSSVARWGRILMWPCLEAWNTNWWLKLSSVILQDYLSSTTCLYHPYSYTLYLYMTLQRTFRKGGWKKCAFAAPDSGIRRTFVILSLALGPSTDKPMTLYPPLFIIQTNSLCLSYECILFSLYQYFSPSLVLSYIHLIIMNGILVILNEYKSSFTISFNVVSGNRSVLHYHHMHLQK